jgi:hypothetical protein
VQSNVRYMASTPIFERAEVVEPYDEGPPTQLTVGIGDNLLDDPTRQGQVEYVEFLKKRVVNISREILKGCAIPRGSPDYIALASAVLKFPPDDAKTKSDAEIDNMMTRHYYGGGKVKDNATSPTTTQTSETTSSESGSAWEDEDLASLRPPTCLPEPSVWKKLKVAKSAIPCRACRRLDESNARRDKSKPKILKCSKEGRFHRRGLAKRDACARAQRRT